jgi:hypothetical protein
MDREQVEGCEGCVDLEGVRRLRIQRESGGSEGESVAQWEPTFRSIWERGIFQDCQVGVMG